MNNNNWRNQNNKNNNKTINILTNTQNSNWINQNNNNQNNNDKNIILNNQNSYNIQKKTKIDILLYLINNINDELSDITYDNIIKLYFLLYFLNTNDKNYNNINLNDDYNNYYLNDIINLFSKINNKYNLNKTINKIYNINNYIFNIKKILFYISDHFPVIFYINNKKILSWNVRKEEEFIKTYIGKENFNYNDYNIIKNDLNIKNYIYINTYIYIIIELYVKIFDIDIICLQEASINLNDLFKNKYNTYYNYKEKNCKNNECKDCICINNCVYKAGLLTIIKNKNIKNINIEYICNCNNFINNNNKLINKKYCTYMKLSYDNDIIINLHNTNKDKNINNSDIYNKIKDIINNNIDKDIYFIGDFNMLDDINSISLNNNKYQIQIGINQIIDNLKDDNLNNIYNINNDFRYITKNNNNKIINRIDKLLFYSKKYFNNNIKNKILNIDKDDKFIYIEINNIQKIKNNNNNLINLYNKITEMINKYYIKDNNKNYYLIHINFYFKYLIYILCQYIYLENENYILIYPKDNNNNNNINYNNEYNKHEIDINNIIEYYDKIYDIKYNLISYNI